MNNNDIANALMTLRPGAQWVLQGNDLSGLQWLDTTQTRPTDAEITAAIAAYVPPPSLQDQIVALQAQVAALIAAQSLQPKI
jgi:hypothetical protein